MVVRHAKFDNLADALLARGWSKAQIDELRGDLEGFSGVVELKRATLRYMSGASMTHFPFSDMKGRAYYDFD